MKKFDYAVKQLIEKDRLSSFATRANRFQQLKQIGSELRKMGYLLDTPKSLKTKHINALVQHWKEEELSTGSIKNRLSNLRWLVSRPEIHKENIVPRTNAELGIENRVYKDNESNRAFELKPEHLENIKSELLKASLELQKEFGLRREECLKIRPSIADKGDRIELQSSWTKGGRPRAIPIRTEEQRAALDRAKKLVGHRESMIPQDKNYKTWMKHYENETRKAGIDGHGMRHQYAQERYRELTGLECPKNGGPTLDQLDKGQKEKVSEARLIISHELGHGREIIANNYLGR